MNDYDKLVAEFLEQTGTTITILRDLDNPKPIWYDGNHRDSYQITLSNGNGKLTFNYWVSIKDTMAGNAPSEYDVLSALDYWEPNYDEFCIEMDFNTDSRRARSAWKEIIRISKGLKAMFSEEQIELLTEIR